MIYNQRDILRIIAKILNCSEDQLYKQSGLSKTLNWDSLNHVIILSTIEEYLKIKINDEMFSKLLTIGDIVNYLDNYQIEICIDEGQCNCGTLCFEEKKVEFKSLDGTNLVGVFCSTKQESKGFILLTHGIPSEKDENGFHRNMAMYFAKNGYDSFRFDFRYMGESQKGKEEDITIHNLIEDIESAYKIAISLYARNTSVQYVVGTSCGGGVLLKWINDYNHVECISKAFLCCPVLDYVFESSGINKANIYEKKDEILRSLEKEGYIKDRDAQYGKSFFLQSLDFDADLEVKKYGKQLIIYHGNQDPSVPISFSEEFANRNYELVDLVVVDWARHGFGVPFFNKAGDRISDDMRYKIKKRNQSGVIHSIVCSIKGAE